MGHRAYIAYVQPNSTFTVHYTHWGGHNLILWNRITDLEPFGGPNDIAPSFVDVLNQQLAKLADEEDME